MQFDFQKMAAAARYELLLGTVVPRPIALVKTVTQHGVINAAPYSHFNVIGHAPPTLMISVLPHPDQRLNDTASNILATREFVVNLVSEAIAEAMNTTSIDAPAGTNLGLMGSVRDTSAQSTTDSKRIRGTLGPAREITLQRRSDTCS